MLTEKASNFRAYLKANATKDIDALLASYADADLVPLIQMHLLPLYLLGQLDIAVDHVREATGCSDPAFLEKTKRYFTCFCELVF